MKLKCGHEYQFPQMDPEYVISKALEYFEEGNMFRACGILKEYNIHKTIDNRIESALEFYSGERPCQACECDVEKKR